MQNLYWPNCESYTNNLDVQETEFHSLKVKLETLKSGQMEVFILLMQT